MPREERRRRSREPEPVSLKDKAFSFVSGFVQTEGAQFAELLSGTIGPWIKQFGLHASGKVKATTARGATCQYMVGPTTDGPCKHTANIECAGCYKLICLGHAFLSWKGHALCIECVEVAREVAASRGHRAQPPPPPPGPGRGPWGSAPDDGPWSAPGPRDGQHRTPSVDPREFDALREMGLEPGVTWAEIQKEFRAFSSVNHPDKFQGAQKVSAEARFKRVSAAFEVLKQIHAARAA